MKPTRHFLAIPDFSPAELLALFDLAARMKRGEYREKPLAGKTLGMIFAKSSTRTRVSFEVGAYQLGGHALFLSSRDIQLGRGEPIRDTARVLSRYLDGIMIRTYDHADVEELARYGSIPVINGLTDLLHPCQVLADLLTVRESLGGWDGKVVAWVGDGNNMANSWINAAGSLGFELRLACPAGYEPNAEILAAQPREGQDHRHRRSRARRCAAPMSSTPTCGPRWARRRNRPSRARAFQGYIVDAALMALADPSRDLPPLPAGASGRGGLRSGDRRAAVPGVGRGGEPAPRAEGADGHADGSSVTNERDRYRRTAPHRTASVRR